MAENKTKPTEVSVDEFIAQIDHPKKQADALVLKAMMEEITGEKAVMWGPTIIGFGSYHYQYDSGHKGDAPIVGFSPRKAAISLYLLGCFEKEVSPLLDQLGKCKKSVSCLYANKLSDLNEPILRELIAQCYSSMKAKYPSL